MVKVTGWAEEASPGNIAVSRATVARPTISRFFMASPYAHAGRVRQWLSAVQAAMVTGRASKPPATQILRPVSSEMAHPARYPAPMTDPELAAAWAAVHDATPEGWYVGRPYFDERQNRWEQYPFDPSETPVVGKRSREWTAVGPTELRCVQTMADCLRELGAGRWPK